MVGKPGTGKTTKAMEYLSDNPIVMYADEYDIHDNYSIPTSRGILIEDVHHKPNTDAIKKTLREYRGQIVITSINQKSVPKDIFNMCKLKRAGSKKHLQDSIRTMAPNAVEPREYDLDVFSLVVEYLKNENRDEVVELLKLNKPPDALFLSLLSSNIHPNKLVFVDSEVKRKWPVDYFYELIAYKHEGKIYRRLSFDKRYPKSDLPSICRKLGLKKRESYLLDGLLQDPDFVSYAKTVLDNKQCRVLKLGEKRRRKKTDPTPKSSLLEDF